MRAPKQLTLKFRRVRPRELQLGFLVSTDNHWLGQAGQLGVGESLGELDALPGLGGEDGAAIGALEVHAAFGSVVAEDIAHESREL